MADQDRINECIEEFADTVYRVAFLYLRHKADAEDITQTVFLKLCDSEAALYEPEIVKAWLIRVTSNLCKNELKRFWRTRTIELDESYPAIANPEHKELTDEVLRLPASYRGVIYLHYYEGYQTGEIAALLNRNPSTIRTQLKRGRELLHKTLTKGGGDIANASTI